MRGWRRKNADRETNNGIAVYDHQYYDDDSSDDDSSATTNDDDSDSDDFHVSESEILYSVDSFYAVVTPVTITMVVSALVVALRG